MAYDDPADTVKPKPRILVSGINAYIDKGWIPPCSSKKLDLPLLNLAVADARFFAAGMKKAGAGLYSEVRVTKALDTDATPTRFDELAGQMAATISPCETFALWPPRMPIR